jgi:hypothetical protein
LGEEALEFVESDGKFVEMMQNDYDVDFADEIGDA